MGQLIDEDDCEVCEPFDQEWIFTYGDLVTLLLCFFILLFSMCKLDVEKFRQVAESFKGGPPASPHILDSQDAAIPEIKQEIETSELAEEAEINVDDRGLVVSFSASAFFEPESAELSKDAEKQVAKFATFLYLQPNRVQIEGHTDSEAPKEWPSAWALSGARASAVARQLIQEGVDGKNITVKAFGGHRPQFQNATPQQRLLNHRVEVIIIPQS